jgi:uncharacterized membrane protein YhiD involved in acid resistance
MDQTSVACRSGTAPASCTGQVPQYTTDVPLPQAAPAAAPWLHGKGRGLLWGVGGTVLSVVGFVAMLGFEAYNGMLSELRTDLKHFNETSSEFVKKESMQRFRDQMKEYVKEVQAVNGARLQLEQELRVSEKMRSEMTAELQRMRERLAYLEGRHAATQGTEAPTSPNK